MKAAIYTPVYNRKNRPRKNGTALVQIRVTYARQRRYFSTGIYVHPDQWDDEKWVVNHPDYKRYNTRIREQIHELEQYEIRARYSGESFTLRILPGNQRERLTFLTFMKSGIEDSDLAPGTKKQHRATYHHLLSFGKISGFADLTRTNIMELDRYFHRVLEQQSSVHGQHKRVRRWIRQAMNAGYVMKDPYMGMEISPGNRNTIRYLEEGELHLMEEKQMPMERLTEVKDMFLFSCYTGLAYQEAEQLTYDQIRQDEEGTTWIHGTRQKVAGNNRTGSTGEYLIPLHEKAIKILQKYKDRRQGYALPIITNQKYNAYLKEIAILCGIDKHLTTHVARHTFATTFTLSKGVSIETVQRMLGHASVRMTERYAKVLKDRVKEDMKKVL